MTQEYTVTENITAGPDEEIDLVLKKDGSLVLVKHATSGILITSGIFTQEAKNFPIDKPIDLVDGIQLFQLIGQVQKDRVVSSEHAHANLCPKCRGE